MVKVHAVQRPSSGVAPQQPLVLWPELTGRVDPPQRKTAVQLAHSQQHPVVVVVGGGGRGPILPPPRLPRQAPHLVRMGEGVQAGRAPPLRDKQRWVLVLVLLILRGLLCWPPHEDTGAVGGQVASRHQGALQLGAQFELATGPRLYKGKYICFRCNSSIK